ncbi:hypothetical protein BSP109_02159 [Brevibacterium sp. Mu109]|uniref:hypothetical protein n=1 Tax=Brevibacterium sp. Mu109 TaxID=1255669 RepID=UPI000C4945A8|nr:hypothetical protein [Brevibacterium sp. Mu109]SMX86909.1 hypothetical protein BSP109_02159 [Brevibacterium sp. Mu109]
MKVPMSVLKATVGVPAIVASTLLWIIGLALAPPLCGLLGFTAGVVALVLLATGAAETAAARVLLGARTATAAEQTVFAPVLAHAAAPEASMAQRRLLVRQNVGARTPPVQLLGRESVVVTPWLIEATYRGWLGLDEAAALMVHAEGRHQAEARRCELAMLAWMLPWRALGGIARGIGRVTGWVPFIGFAWALRGVMGVVALVQQVDEGRPALGVLAASIVALTYLVPAANHAIARRVEAEADDLVVRRGLGPSMSAMLRRYRLPVSLERLHHLDGSRHGAHVPVAG